MSVKRLKSAEVEEIHKNKADQLNGDIIMSENMEKFSNDLYKIVTCYEKGNFSMSGLSVYLALSMCSLGAKNNTAKELHEALYLDQSVDLINIKNIITSLLNAEKTKLGIVNRIFADEKIIIKEAFKSGIKNTFLSKVKSVDFQSETERLVQDVNNWCSKKTNHKINNILSNDDIDDTTRLIILNAVYFKAYWKSEFEVVYTRFEPFYVSKTKTIRVPTMQWDGYLKYKDFPDLYAECIAKPYRNPDFVFVIIKPKEVDGLKYVEQNLDKIDLDYQKMDDRDILLMLPKFRIETMLDLNQHLEKVKIVEAFTPQANFKGISEKPILSPPLHMDKVIQKAFIEVNEEGTGTAEITMFRLTGSDMADFKVDRPFLFRVVNVKYNLTLFSGRVVIPECT